MPTIPKSHDDVMDQQFPDILQQTCDKQDFLVYKDWVNAQETLSMLVFLSDWGANVMKNSTTIWYLDGTFRTALVSNPTLFWAFLLYLTH